MVDFFDFLKEREGNSEVLADGDEGGDVFRKAGAAVADAGVEEIAANALVRANAVGDFFDIRAAGFADAGDGVDVGNLKGQKGIRRVLDEFGRVDVRNENRSHERLVDFLHHRNGTLAVAADDDAVGLHEVRHRAAFPEKFGITHDIKFRAALVIAADRVGDFLAGFHGHGALVDDHAVLAGLEDGGNLAGDLLNVGKIDAAIWLWRGGDGDENDIGAIHSFLGAGGEMKAPGSDIAVEKVLEAGFVNGNFSGTELFDFFSVVIDANHIVADFGEASAGDETNISGSNNAEFHGYFFR